MHAHRTNIPKNIHEVWSVAVDLQHFSMKFKHCSMACFCLVKLRIRKLVAHNAIQTAHDKG